MFSADFFTWTNAPECPDCKSTTKHTEYLDATPDEIRWGGGRVEGYRCTQCQRQVRFPRYNHPQKLLGVNLLYLKYLHTGFWRKKQQ